MTIIASVALIVIGVALIVIGALIALSQYWRCPACGRINGPCWRIDKPLDLICKCGCSVWPNHE